MNDDEEIAEKSESIPRSTEHTEVKHESCSVDHATAAEPADTTTKIADPPQTENEFDFSSRKLLIHGLPKYFDDKKCRNLLNTWREELNSRDRSNPDEKLLEYEKIKKAPNCTFIRVTVAHDSMVDPLLAYVNSSEILVKNRRLSAQRGNETQRSKNKRPNGKAVDDAAQAAKRIKQCTPVTPDELKDKVIPLWKASPEEQRDIKMKSMVRQCALKIVTELKKKLRQLNKGRKAEGRPLVQPFAWMSQAQPITVDPLVTATSPVRNKCEFTIGLNSEQKPAAGFMASGWSGGVSFCDNLPHIPTEATEVLKRFNAFLASSTVFRSFDQKSNTGFWRLVTIRSSQRTGECMIVVQHSAVAKQEKVGDVEGSLADRFLVEKNHVVTLLTESPLTQDPKVCVTSIFFQEYEGASVPNANHPVQTTITERLGECHFEISPGSFFQTNTEAAEALYSIAARHVKMGSSSQPTLLLDVCCGTGTIGLTCLKAGAVERVVGVDICEPAIENAKRNAVLNGYDDETTTKFVAGRAEHVLAGEIRQQNGPVVALVDPARDGLHGNVVKTLRTTDRLERLVYISCNPTGSLVRDAVLFCAPATKKYAGRPFKIVSATPVDMFPMTNHCEMVMVFERLTEAEEKGEEISPTTAGDRSKEDKQHTPDQKEPEKQSEEAPTDEQETQSNVNEEEPKASLDVEATKTE